MCTSVTELMTFINVYVINAVVNFMSLLVDYSRVLCSSTNELQHNSNVSSREEYIVQNNMDCFVVDLLRLHLTFVTICLLSVVCKQ